MLAMARAARRARRLATGHRPPTLCPVPRTGTGAVPVPTAGRENPGGSTTCGVYTKYYHLLQYYVRSTTVRSIYYLY